MATRRMFSKDVVFTDDFLDMPMSARALYFMLGMWADDDGFVDAPKSVQRQCGASDDDMRVLLAKRYVIQFENGIIVIRHWHLNNYLRQDRYKETIHLEEKAYLELNEGKYGLVDTRYTTGIPTVNPGKDRLGKDSIDNIYPPIIPPTESKASADANDATAKGVVCNSTEEGKKKRQLDASLDAPFQAWWDAYPKRRRGAKQECRKKYESAIKNTSGLTPEKMLQALEAQKKTKDWQKQKGEFVPAPLTWLNQGRWEDEIYDPQKDDNSEPIDAYELSEEDKDICI